VFGPAVRWDGRGAALPFDHPDSDAFGNVVASRWPIDEHAVVPLPGVESGEHRSVLAARIDSPEGTLPFLTTHFNWKLDDGHVRERQAVAVAALARTWAADAPLPPVVVGDLNAEPDSNEVRFLCGLAALAGRSAYFQDAWRVAGLGPGYTWDNANPFAAHALEPNRRIDYVLVGPPMGPHGRGRIENARLGFTEPRGDVFPSDHFGVVADLRA
jgi:endonuclease/exonuclease/phosphatase family metal-dependent hydrolase